MLASCLCEFLCTSEFVFGAVDNGEGALAYFFEELVVVMGVFVFLDLDHVLVEEEGLFGLGRFFCSNTLDTHKFRLSNKNYHQM